MFCLSFFSHFPPFFIPSTPPPLFVRPCISSSTPTLSCFLLPTSLPPPHTPHPPTPRWSIRDVANPQFILPLFFFSLLCSHIQIPPPPTLSSKHVPSQPSAPQPVPAPTPPHTHTPALSSLFFLFPRRLSFFLSCTRPEFASRGERIHLKKTAERDGNRGGGGEGFVWRCDV